MGEIGVSELGKTLNSNKDTGELTPYLCSINIHWTCINLEEVKKTRFTKEEQRKYILLKNDLLVCEGGDIGRCFVWNFPIPMYYQNALHRIRFYNEINPFFFKFAIEYYKNIHILDKYSKGVTIKHLTKTALHSICFPLPPLLEQHRIVEKIEELLALVDDLETNKTDLQSYIKQAKSKVLEMAIRGELVPQNPEDEPASILLERIKKEQKSSKSKGKTTEHNTHYEEELLFDIPENWALTQMENICQLLDGEKKQGVELPYLDVKFLRGKIEGEIKESGKYIPKNTHLILVDGENSGEIFKAQQDGYQGSTLKILNISEEICKKYIFYILKKEQKLFKESKTGSAIPHLNKKLFNDLLIFLPPLSEQHRIVEKIEHIFAVLEELEKNIL